MIGFHYGNVDQWLVRELPELIVPYAHCLDNFGNDEHPGQYLVFEGVFACYIEVLLALSASASRDALLARAFTYVEKMQQCDDRNVRDLVNIAVFEGRSAWWYGRAAPFIGPHSRAFLDRFQSRWRRGLSIAAAPDPEREIIDLHGVRRVVFRLLEQELAGRGSVPGILSLDLCERFVSLRQAQEEADATIFLSCFSPYVVGPATAVRCDEAALLQLAQGLARLEDREPEQWRRARVSYYRIPLGERVWCMRTSDEERHGRYTGALWIAPLFLVRGLALSIAAVLAGQGQRL